MNKHLVVSILAGIATVVGRLRIYRILPGTALHKVWRFLSRNRLVGDIPFGFDVEFLGTRFRLEGPFQHAAGDYYVEYLTWGGHESPTTAHITQVVRECPSPRFLDVGAHYGWYTIYLAKVIADRGPVFAIEPSEAIFSILKRNLELNSINNVCLYKLPLSDKHETISMVPSKPVPRESRYMRSVTEEVAINNTTVDAIPFDELNEREAIHPNIVKIDVHGVWRKVIDGMTASLRRDVEHLYLELDSLGDDLSSKYEDIQHVILTLREAGMDVYEIQDYFKRTGGKMLQADVNRIARKGITLAMLYAVKRK